MRPPPPPLLLLLFTAGGRGSSRRLDLGVKSICSAALKSKMHRRSVRVQ